MDDWDKIEAEIVEANRRATDSVDALRAEQRLADARALAIREGWSDENGNSLLDDDEDDEDDH